jgi:hypothetical protein
LLVQASPEDRLELLQQVLEVNKTRAAGQPVEKLSSFHFICNLLLLEHRSGAVSQLKPWSPEEVEVLQKWIAQIPKTIYSVHKSPALLKPILSSTLRLMQEGIKPAQQAFAEESTCTQLAVFFHWSKTTPQGKVSSGSPFASLDRQCQALALNLTQYVEVHPPALREALEAATALVQ